MLELLHNFLNCLILKTLRNEIHCLSINLKIFYFDENRNLLKTTISEVPIFPFELKLKSISFHKRIIKTLEINEKTIKKMHFFL